MHEVQQFSPFPRERWERVKAALKAKVDIDIVADAGTAEGHGIKLGYAWDEKAGTLTLQTLEKPFYLSEAVVDQKIHDFVEATA